LIFPYNANLLHTAYSWKNAAYFLKRSILTLLHNLIASIPTLKAVRARPAEPDFILGPGHGPVCRVRP